MVQLSPVKVSAVSVDMGSEVDVLCQRIGGWLYEAFVLAPPPGCLGNDGFWQPLSPVKVVVRYAIRMDGLQACFCSCL